VSLFGHDGVAHFHMRIDERTGSVLVLECKPPFRYTLPATMWRGLNFVEVGICIPILDVPKATGTFMLRGAVVGASACPKRLKQIARNNFKGFLQPYWTLYRMQRACNRTGQRRCVERGAIEC